jgi:hypothetical protein
VARGELDVVDPDQKLEWDAPGAVRPELERERHLPRARLGSSGHRNREAPLPVTVAEVEDHLLSDDLDGVEAPRREPVLFDLEEMGEIGADVDRKAEIDRVASEISKRKQLAHSLADVAVAHHDEGRIGDDRRRSETGDETTSRRIGLDHRQRSGHRAVHAQSPDGQEPGVRDEKAVTPTGVDVADGVRDAKRRAVEQRDRARVHPATDGLEREVPCLDHRGGPPRSPATTRSKRAT